MAAGLFEECAEMTSASEEFFRISAGVLNWIGELPVVHDKKNAGTRAAFSQNYFKVLDKNMIFKLRKIKKRLHKRICKEFTKTAQNKQNNRFLLDVKTKSLEV